MKTSLLPVSLPQSNHELDQMIETEHLRIKKSAYDIGKQHGMKEPPLPLVKGDKIIHFIGGIKGSYEQLVMKVLKKILPAIHMPEGRIDRDHAEIHNKRLTDGIAKLRKQKELFKRELGDRNPEDLLSKIKNTRLICFCLFIGETIINTFAFEVLGDNLLFSLLLSASVAFAVSLGAHIAGRKYKDAKTKRERNIVIVISSIGILVVSGVIAALRSIFLKKIGIDINPVFLAIFNIAFFVVACLVTYFMHPSTEEIKQNEEAIKLHEKIEKLKAEIQEKENETIEHETTTKEKLKQNMRSVMYAEYCIEWIRRLYRESVGEFKSTNMLCRQDVPECFSDEVPELDIPEITFNSTINKYKKDEKDIQPTDNTAS